MVITREKDATRVAGEEEEGWWWLLPKRGGMDEERGHFADDDQRNFCDLVVDRQHKYAARITENVRECVLKQKL